MALPDEKGANTNVMYCNYMLWVKHTKKLWYEIKLVQYFNEQDKQNNGNDI